MAKQKKTPRPKAETPKGFRDYFGAEVVERTEMLDRIAEVYRLWGFDPLESSAVETVEALGKFLPDVDRPNAGVFAWQEDAGAERPGDWLALRYDLTAPLARVWRNEKPGPGRFRQFYQCDADTVGAGSVAADAEICMMLADALEAVGIARGDYVIRVNNRKVLNGVLEVAGIAEDDERTRGIVLRAIDKLDRLGPEGVRALLGEGRKDESGDFTKGAGLGASQIHVMMTFVEASDEIRMRLQSEGENADEHAIAGIRAAYEDLSMQNSEKRFDPTAARTPGAGLLWNVRTYSVLREIVETSDTGRQGVEELKDLVALAEGAGYGPDRIFIDPSVVRGLGYYTGPVFAAELTFEITDDEGRPRQFGSVAGGGRYDDLVKRFTGQAVPATGISIGVDRLLAALHAKGLGSKTAAGPVVVTVMDRDRMADYLAMAAELRAAGIRAEVYLGNPKNFGNQLKYADRRGAPVAVIQGEDERARGVVQVKDLVLGAKLAETATLEEWKDQPAQVECAEGDLVATVRRMLERG